MLAGCMDIVWSMAGVITAPWWKEGRDKNKVKREGRREQQKKVDFFSDPHLLPH